MGKVAAQPARCVYESGPTGFDLQRKLSEAGVECCVGAVSKMLRPSGDRVKIDERDAVFLARMLAVGNIVEVAVPSPQMEAARDLSRAREDCRHDLMRARHMLLKFLLRKGIVYPGKCAWTKVHGEWLASLSFEDPCERLVFDETWNPGALPYASFLNRTRHANPRMRAYASSRVRCLA